MGVTPRGNSCCIMSLIVFCFVLKISRNDVNAFHFVLLIRYPWTFSSFFFTRQPLFRLLSGSLSRIFPIRKWINPVFEITLSCLWWNKSVRMLLASCTWSTYRSCKVSSCYALDAKTTQSANNKKFRVKKSNKEIKGWYYRKNSCISRTRV